AARYGRLQAAADDAPYRQRRLVDGDLLHRADGALSRPRLRPAGVAAAAADSVRRLRGVAAGAAARRSPRPAAPLLDGAPAGPSAVGAPARSPASRVPELARRL